jgi:hypothetical protein
MSLDEMLQKQGRTIKEFRDELEPSIRLDIKRQLVIARVADENGIKVSNNDVLQEAARIAKRYGIKGKQFKELLKNKEFVVSTVENIFEAKVYEFLVRQVRFITESGDPIGDGDEIPCAASVDESSPDAIESSDVLAESADSAQEPNNVSMEGGGESTDD